jgi:hypothetical protein
MTERDPAIGGRDQAGLLGRQESVDVNAQQLRGGHHDRDVAGAVERADQQQRLRRRGEPFHQPREDAAQPGCQREFLAKRFRAEALRPAQAGQQLEQRERVSGRHGQEPLPNVCRDPGCAAVENRCGRFVVQSGQLQPGQTGSVEGACISGCRGEQDRHRIGSEPTRGEHKRLYRRAVEPLHIVDDTQDRVLLGSGCQQAERPRRDEKAVAARRRSEPERAGQRLRLQLGDVVELVERRPKQTEQARKRKLGLRLGACDP